jgi:APC family amino acid-polyamine-organocation transporter
VKNDAVALAFGVWCFLITAASCLLGMHSKDTFTMALNIITPLVLSILGIIMPLLAKNEKQANA